VSGKKVSNCHIIGLDNASLVLMVVVYNQQPYYSWLSGLSNKLLKVIIFCL
jgi:hypothetical protein